MAVSEAFKTHSAEAFAAPGARPLLWLSFVCLDAPMVAVTWQLFFARVVHYSVTTRECAALFLTAWGIYLIDRLADSMSLNETAPFPARIAFCRDHRAWLVVTFLLVGMMDAAISIRLSAWLIVQGAALGVAAAIYLLINQRAPQLWRVLPIKEVVVGVVFALGTTLFLFQQESSPGVVLMVVLFAVLCSLNTLSIACWERELDLRQGKYSFATKWPGGGKVVRLLCLFLSMIGCSLAMAGFEPLLSGAIAISSASFLVIHFISVPADERTALADLALLSPIVFLFTT